MYSYKMTIDLNVLILSMENWIGGRVYGSLIITMKTDQLRNSDTKILRIRRSHFNSHNVTAMD